MGVENRSIALLFKPKKEFKFNKIGSLSPVMRCICPQPLALLLASMMNIVLPIFIKRERVEITLG